MLRRVTYRQRGVSLSVDDGLPNRDKAASTQTARKPGSGADRDVGAALRTVYQKTVEEKVPDEFLDLLGKLG